jgi:TM2 domain-containing membrane protein YozV
MHNGARAGVWSPDPGRVPRFTTKDGAMQTELPPTARQPGQPGMLSSDARAMMLFEANKKTAVIAYLLWFFLGMFGAHNFYLKRTGTAVAQLILTITLIGSLVTMVWVLVDAFLIPGWVRNQNNLLAMQLGA